VGQPRRGHGGCPMRQNPMIWRLFITATHNLNCGTVTTIRFFLLLPNLVSESCPLDFWFKKNFLLRTQITPAPAKTLDCYADRISPRHLDPCRLNPSIAITRRNHAWTEQTVG